MEQSGNMQLEMNAKVAAIRQDLNVFLNRCIDTFDKAVKEGLVSKAKSERFYRETIQRIKEESARWNLLSYVAYILLGIFGISYAGIDPVFLSFKTYRQFCDHMEEHAPRLKKAEEIHQATREVAQAIFAFLEAFLTGLTVLKDMLNASAENTLLCYQCFTSISRIPKNRNHEDLVMLLSVFDGCGISIDMTEQKMYDEDVYTTKFQVNDFVKTLKAKYASDPEIQKLLENLACKDA